MYYYYYCSLFLFQFEILKKESTYVMHKLTTPKETGSTFQYFINIL